VTPAVLAAIEAKWEGYSAAMGVRVDDDGDVYVTASEDHPDHTLAHVDCDDAAELAALWAGAGPEVLALVAEVRRLTDVIARERQQAEVAEARHAGLRAAVRAERDARDARKAAAVPIAPAAIVDTTFGMIAGGTLPGDAALAAAWASEARATVALDALLSDGGAP